MLSTLRHAQNVLRRCPFTRPCRLPDPKALRRCFLRFHFFDSSTTITPLLYLGGALGPPAAPAAGLTTFLPSLLNRTRGGGARLRRPSRERTLRSLDQSGSSYYPLFLPSTLVPVPSQYCPNISTYRTIFPWMAQLTQYCSFRYILGTLYSAKTEASEISRMAALSTMLRMVNLLIALSLGVQREQLEQRIGFT